MRSTVNFASALVVSSALVLGVSAGAEAQSARELYNAAQRAEKRLHQSADRLGSKPEWVRVAKLYRQVVIEHPRSGYCDDALYFEAELYREVDRRFGGDSVAVQRALDAYLLLANGYPSSQWALKARLNRGRVFFERLNDRKNASIELRKVTSLSSDSAEGLEAKRLLDQMTPPRPRTRKASATHDAPVPAGMVGVRNIRHWTSKEKEYTRIVIDLDDEVKYEEGQVKNPDRIYFDLHGTRLTGDLGSREFPIDGGFLRQIRVGQNQHDVVRVVLDFDNVSDYKVFWLPDPYRLVVDILGTEPAPKPPPAVVAEKAPERAPSPSQRGAAESMPAPPPGPRESSPPAGAEPVATADASDRIEVETELRLPPAPNRDGDLSISRQLALRAGKVIIDPGHGGHDPGTMKYGLKEKDLVLDISRRVAKLLEKDFEVLMTRDKDVFIPLEERTAIANTKGGDLFVSIHVNAARSARPRGIETYYLNLATSPDAAEVAARENAVTTRRMAELSSLLQKVMNNSRIVESRDFASHVQDSMAVNMLSSKKDARNRGVKTAPFYVLLGAQIPSILVEVAYITNKNDATQLDDAAYRQKLAESIAEGIQNYHHGLAPTTSVRASVANE